MSERRPNTESELIELLRASDVRAPDALHEQLESMIAARSRGSRRTGTAGRTSSGARSRFGLGLSGTIAIAAIAAAAIAIALAVGVSGNDAGTLSLRQASALAVSSATMPAPAESEADHGQLAAAVDGVSFPYWEDHFGWRSTGAREDTINGHAVTTVFYQDQGGRRIGYSIVAGSAPAMPGGGATWRSGVRYRIVSENGRQTISWLRDGRLCIVSGRGVSTATLLALASWTDRGDVPS